MSSRGEFIGQGPSSGLYEVGNVPADPQDIPTFINDELLKVSGHLGNSKAGEVFPVMSELPPRFKEGMTVFFTKKQPDPHINSAGVYIYKTGTDGNGNKIGLPRWWKMIDDPSETNGTRMVFKLTLMDAKPPKPINTNDNNPPPGWEFTPPEKGSKSDYIWVSVNTAYDPDSYVTEWSEPTIWSAGVKDGDTGMSSTARYLASTSEPNISDKMSLDPVTTSGEHWTVEIPEVSHPDKSYIWITTGFFREGESQMTFPWSDPYKYSTPETTSVVMAYSLSDSSENKPTFDPTATGLPGPEWSYDQPEVTSDKYLWTTSRLEWFTGDTTVHQKMSDWTPMFLASGKSGAPGAGFYRIGVTQTEFNDLTTLWSGASNRFKNHTGSDPYVDDVLTFFVSPETSPPQSNTRRFDGTSWVSPELLIDGDMIATGTIVGDRIVAGTQIEAPVIHGGSITADVSLTSASITGGTISGSHFKGNGSSGDLALGGTNQVGTANAWIDANGNASFGGNFNITGSGHIGGNMIIDGEISAGKVKGNISSSNYHEYMHYAHNPNGNSERFAKLTVERSPDYDQVAIIDIDNADGYYRVFGGSTTDAGNLTIRVTAYNGSTSYIRSTRGVDSGSGFMEALVSSGSPIIAEVPQGTGKYEIGISSTAWLYNEPSLRYKVTGTITISVRLVKQDRSIVITSS